MKSRKTHPPRSAELFLSWLCKSQFMEEIIGDLHEYHDELKTKPAWKRRVLFWFHVLQFLRPWALKRLWFQNSNHSAMLQHHVKITFRNFSRQKMYSTINAGGLIAGIAVVILIGLWINDELSFNKQNDNYGSVARVLRTETSSGDRRTGDNQPFALAQLLRTNYGHHFQHVAMEVTWTGEHTIATAERKFLEEGRYVESAAPGMLGFEVISGDEMGLSEPNTILISSSLAKKLFEDDEPIGQVVSFDADTRLSVAGVYQDVPVNSDFHGIEYLISFDVFYKLNTWAKPDSWRGNNVNVYVQLKPAANPELAGMAIKDVLLTHIKDEAKLARRPAFSLHPMSDWHFYSNFDDKPGTMSAELKFVWFYGIIGLFILLLACINFINLSTARFERRAKEVGVRKTLGSKRKQLIGQFLTESLITVALAFVLSLGLVSLLLPWFNNVSAKAIELPWLNPVFWLTGLGFIMITGLLAGSYPAFYLSSFQPVRALKGAVVSGRAGVISRRVLVVFQFTVSIALVIGSLIVHEQLQFARNRPIGYSQQGLVMVKMTTEDYKDKYQLLRTELLNSGMVEQVAGAGAPITQNQYSNKGFDWKGKAPDYDPIFNDFYISPEMGETVDWQILNGRDFSADIQSDRRGVVINESAAKILGFDNPVGQVLIWKSRDNQSFTVLGVVKDMVRRSPYETIPPSLFFLSDDLPWMHIKVQPQVSMVAALAAMEDVFEELLPEEPFECQFVDESYAAKFRTEERVGQLAGFFTALAILISCLGLLGLATFVTEQRTKEIGIRKVLGASVASLWKLLSKDFLMLVGLASLVAIPIAWYFLEDWLANYEYRTDLRWTVFVLAAIGASLLTIITVSYQTIKVSLLNPVESLRSE